MRLFDVSAIVSSRLTSSVRSYTESDPYDYGKPPAGSIPQTDAPLEYVPIRPQAPRITPSGSWKISDLAPIGERINFCADYAFQATTIGSYLELRFNGTYPTCNTPS